MNVHLPRPEQIRTLFADLLERDVTVTPCAPVAPGPATPASVAVYTDDADRPVAVISCDLDLSARAGAAIGLVPQSGAERAIRSGFLDGPLGENLHEVLDVATTMFNVDGATHVRLSSMHAAGADLPPEVWCRALTLGRRTDIEVDIAGYGGGRLSTVLLPVNQGG
jgi:hypothetical protein